MGAGGKSVAPAAVGGVAEVGEAGGTGRRVGADGGGDGASATFQDVESRLRQILGFVDGLQSVNTGQARNFCGQSGKKLVQPFACHGDRDTLAVIAYPAAESEFVRQAPDVGPEADSLDEAKNVYVHETHIASPWKLGVEKVPKLQDNGKPISICLQPK